MSDINTPERLNVPLRDKDGYYYPLTTYNQIIMPDGVSRWDGTTGGSITTNENGELMNNGEVVHVNAHKLNGLTLEELKAVIMSEAVYQ